ncbi:hypothetical protein SAM23877_4807 [Streptomyces ambofaciens ATCC 23877]|uniref:LigA protein n=1 Tax=Streptomyces ambofaciens (strain ATCC 23877 / 3486 / DSM 40053 / JCM 4204 / NBRC 12836 / NRRL B-2516) TaxID=278992 RepID=A0A0K2AYE3_STRA7|nr:hypothetical protein [Streptomyces ambofaciens]AKZ57852.1 hypothetical protein SAM23877_4807 [Streptomyces ambofaciens ATCC 23877]
MPENQDQELFEERLSAALHETGGRFDADRSALVTGGRTRGRRALTRRRAGVLGGVAGVALVGVGGAMLLPQGDSDGRDVSAATTGATSAPSASATTPAPPPVSGDTVLGQLKELLPDGEFSQEDARGSADEPSPYAYLVYDDGKGAAAISMGLYRVEPGSDQVRQLMECPDETFVPHDSCSSTRLPDGSLLRLFKGYEYPDKRVETKLWSADLVTDKGQHVSLSEWNAPAQKGAPVSRAEPPLSAGQLKEVVTAEVWRRVVDAIPEDPKSARPTEGAPSADVPPAPVSGKDANETLVGLLPEGLDVVKEGGQESEFTYVVVDDGQGESLVQVNVQYGMNDVAGQLYANGETLPDGTRVAVRQGNGDDRVAGVLMWTADTLRPGEDGFRVVISAFNNGAAHAEPSRATPALTIDQLREMALSPEWDELR